MTSPVDLPRRLAASIGNSIDAAGELPVFQQKVLEHLASMDQAMSEHLASMDGSTAALVRLIEPMRADIAELTSRSVEFERSTASIDRALGELQAVVAHIDERIPDPHAGPVAKLKEVVIRERAGP